MLPVIGSMLSVVLGLAKIVMLILVFHQTRRPAAIAYLSYLLINQLLYMGITQKVTNSIQNNEVMLWLGTTPGE